MKLFNDPHNLTAIIVENLPDPAKLDDRSLRALNSLFVDLDYNDAIHADEALEARIDTWSDAVAIESGRRPWASHEARRIAEMLAKQQHGS
jgi:hypothetical protein